MKFLAIFFVCFVHIILFAHAQETDLSNINEPQYKKLSNDYYKWDEECRGKPGDSKESEIGCERRAAVSSQLKDLDCRYDIDNYPFGWKCVMGNSNRQRATQQVGMQENMILCRTLPIRSQLQ